MYFRSSTSRGLNPTGGSIKNVTIIGLGLIGGSLALDLKSRQFAQNILGVDTSQENAATALKLNLISEVLPVQKAVAVSDLIILAIPVDATARVLPEVLGLIQKNATVSDMGSTKKLICDAVKNHPNRSQFVAAHPMAGTENSGPLAAISGLFDSKTAVICDAQQSSEIHLKCIENMFAVLKMRVLQMSSEEHDLHAAYVSHLSHISSFVLANTVLDKEKDSKTVFDLAGGGFESTVRLAKSSPEMWAPIFDQNRSNIISAVELYSEHLNRFLAALRANNSALTLKFMKDSNQIRHVLEAIKKNNG